MSVKNLIKEVKKYLENQNTERPGFLIILRELDSDNIVARSIIRFLMYKGAWNTKSENPDWSYCLNRFFGPESTTNFDREAYIAESGKIIKEYFGIELAAPADMRAKEAQAAVKAKTRSKKR